MTPETIKTRRRELDLSRAELAALCGVSPRTVESWEQGLKRPSGPSVILLSLALKLEEKTNDC
jgi:putative transcriptional regulator